MAKWNYRDIDYHAINHESIREDRFLFTIVSIASFIEITSDLYEKNLVEYYDGDGEITKWLADTWEPEEVQHGQALREYVHHAWPDFDWESSYEGFREEYGALCTIDQFQPSRAREMLARMIVETGTSTLYKALGAYAKDRDEPVLAQICHNIHKDEVYHYDNFEEGFKKYNKQEKLGKIDITKIIYSRLREANDEDIAIAFKYIRNGEDYETFRQLIGTFSKQYYPYNMATKMLMRPLQLNKYLENATASTVQGALRILGI